MKKLIYPILLLAFVFSAALPGGPTRAAPAASPLAAPIGPTLFKDINPDELNGSPRGMTLFNGKFYFRAQDLTYGYEL